MTLELITADSLGATLHGFFTRKGGASSGIFRGLNCGEGSTDQSDIVAINRARAAARIGVAPAALISVRQIHSNRVVAVEAPLTDKPQADAMVTNRPGLALAILTADCQPVLFSDRGAGVVGAAHAGWRGALDGVLEATLDAMEALGARRSHIAAVIGPTISQRAYEVGPEFLATFVADDPGNARFFRPGTGDRLQFDLPGFGICRLQNAGVGSAAWTGDCTYSDPDRFYSYRRSVHLAEADYGRLLSVIRL